MSNKEFAKIADQRMKTQVKVPTAFNTNTNYPITNSSSPTTISKNPIKTIPVKNNSNTGRNIAIGAGAAGVLGAGTIGYMGYNHPEVLQKYMPWLYNRLPDHAQVVKQGNKQLKKVEKFIDKKVTNLQNMQLPNMKFSNINVNNLPEKVGTKLYQYPNLKPFINSADKSYRQLERLSTKTLKRLFR